MSTRTTWSGTVLTPDLDRIRILVELALNVGLWNALSRFHRLMEFELDMPEPPPALDHRLTHGFFPGR